MNRLVGLITGNPTLLLWLALGSFALGLASGAGGAWTVQGWRLDAVQAEFDGFTATVKAQGEAAEKLAKAKADEDKRNKERVDREYQTTIAGLAADVKRLRDDRAELEQAVQRLDVEVSGNHWRRRRGRRRAQRCAILGGWHSFRYVP